MLFCAVCGCGIVDWREVAIGMVEGGLVVVVVGIVEVGVICG